MDRNKKKIIRAITVPQSVDLIEEVMVRLRNEGFEMVMVSSPGPEMNRMRNEEHFYCIDVPMERHISLLKDFKSLISMISVFRKEKPQMIHSITPKAGMISMVAGWLTNVPVRVHTFTGLVWPTATGIKRKILMATDWLTCACATHVIPEGQGVMNDLKNGGITKKPMKVLGYGNIKGIDMKRFDPARFESHKDPSKFVFMFVGRIVGDKGINELVEAFTMLHDKYPQTMLRLVGRYEKDLDPVSELTQNRIDVNTAIDACGPLYGDDLLQAYMDSDCHVMPSYREGFPNTVLEAGALGLPQIVTNINGSREIIEDGKNGLIVPSQTVQPLYDAMERMLNDSALRDKLRRNARSMIESRFEKSFVQDCLIQFYKEIINQ